MKGIILAGGEGSRLYPMTKSISKQLLPIYDKPMIYYSLSVLMLAGIREILIISTPRDLPLFQNLLGDGHQLGVEIGYKSQSKPRGIGDAFILGETFIGNDSVCLILGDNIFYGQGFVEKIEKVLKNNIGATIFGYYVRKPEAFGVVEFDVQYNVISIEEKPEHPKSNYAIPGLYFYDSDVVEIAKSIKPSDRGELEITDINRVYLEQNRLKLEVLGRGMAWLDTGSCQGLLNAANFVETVQTRQGLYIACIEEIAFRKKFINRRQLLDLANDLLKTEYGQYLFRIGNEV